MISVWRRWLEGCRFHNTASTPPSGPPRTVFAGLWMQLLRLGWMRETSSRSNKRIAILGRLFGISLGTKQTDQEHPRRGAVELFRSFLHSATRNSHALLAAHEDHVNVTTPSAIQSPAPRSTRRRHYSGSIDQSAASKARRVNQISSVPPSDSLSTRSLPRISKAEMKLGCRQQLGNQSV